MASPVERRPPWARFLVASVFFVNGAMFASWASRVPAIADRVDAGPAAVAVAVFGLSAGAVVGLPLSGALVSRFGSTAVVRVALVGYAAALVGVAVAPDLTRLTAALVCLGVGNGMLDVAMNAAAVRVERRYGRQIMSAFHAQFSFGGLAGALAGAGAAALGVAPDTHLPVVALVLLVAGMGASFGLLPDAPDRDTGGRDRDTGGSDRDTGGPDRTTDVPDRAAGGPVARRGFAGVDRRLVLLGSLVFCSLLCEGSVYDWSAVYLEDEFGASPAAAALGFAAFSLSMACCRLLADRVVNRVGRAAYVRWAGILATGGLGLVLLGPVTAVGVVGFGVVGLALAGVVPTLFSAAADGHGNPAAAIALVSTIGYLGFLAGPALIGTVATASALWPAMAVLAVLTLVISAGSGVLRQGAGHTEDRAG